MHRELLKQYRRGTQLSAVSNDPVAGTLVAKAHHAPFGGQIPSSVWVVKYRLAAVFLVKSN